MNPLVQELAKQAYEDVIRNTPSFLVTRELYEKRFAELIVQECAGIVDRAISDGGVDGQVLKQHFVIKE